MKTVVDIPDSLLDKAERLSGLPKEDVIVFALESLINSFSSNNDRKFGEDYSHFEFWNSPEDDIYNDLIKSDEKG